MALNKIWRDRPAVLAPQPGETPAEHEARIDAYALANPGVLTLLDALALEDLEARAQAEVDVVDGRVTGLAAESGLQTKRVGVPCGAVGTNVVTTIPDLNPRQLIAVPETTVRWRLRIRNYLMANVNPTGAGIGTFTITGLGIGSPVFPAVTSTATNGRWRGLTTAAMADTIAAASIVADAEYTSEWITDPAKQLGRTPKVLSLGLRTASASWKYGGDFNGGTMFHGAGAADGHKAAAPTFPSVEATYFDWRIECEFSTVRPIVLCIGDSIVQGVSGGDGGSYPHEAWPGQAAMRGDFLAVNAGVGGSATTNWLSLSNWLYARHDLATSPPEVAIFALGHNEGYSNSQVPANYAAMKTLLEGIGVKRFYAGLPIPQNYPVENETIRANLVAWMATVPAGFEGAVLFDRAIQVPGTPASADTVMMPTPPHPIRRGYQAMAALVPQFKR